MTINAGARHGDRLLRARTTSRTGGSWSRATRTSRGSTTWPGKSVCTALGSTYEETLREQAPDADLKLVDTYSECLELLQNGAIDAISTDDVILTGMVIQDDTLKIVGDELTTEPYGAGIKEGETEFQRFVSDAFDAVKQDGRWDETLPGVGRPVHRTRRPSRPT